MGREGLAEMKQEMNVLVRQGETGLETLQENEAAKSETPQERLAETRWEGLGETRWEGLAETRREGLAETGREGLMGIGTGLGKLA